MSCNNVNFALKFDDSSDGNQFSITQTQKVDVCGEGNDEKDAKMNIYLEGLLKTSCNIAIGSVVDISPYNGEGESILDKSFEIAKNDNDENVSDDHYTPIVENISDNE